jgi:nucleoside-diphosphate-sugar epimerase
MNSSNELHVIFGTGPLGKATMRELLKQGKRVRMVNRKGAAEVPAEVEIMKGDATDPASTRQLSEGASVVYNCTNPPYTKWPEMFPPLQAGILEGAAAAGAKLVSAENTYMYGEVDGPQTENLPNAAHTRKGRTRARMAEDLLAAHQSGKVRAAIGRASDFYGPEVLGSATGDRLFYPLLAGKKVSVPGNLDAPHTYTYIDDFGKGLVKLGEDDRALGQIWHIPSAPTLTTRQFLELAFEVAGLKPNYGVLPDYMLKLAGLFIPEAREVVEMLYEFKKPFIVDHSKYERTFGSEITPHREALAKTIEWFRAHPQQKGH